MRGPIAEYLFTLLLVIFSILCNIAHVTGYIIGYESTSQVNSESNTLPGISHSTIIQLAIVGPLCFLVVLLIWCLWRRPFNKFSNRIRSRTASVRGASPGITTAAVSSIEEVLDITALSSIPYTNHKHGEDGAGTINTPISVELPALPLPTSTRLTSS